MLHNGDPNVVPNDKYQKTTMILAAEQDNVPMMKSLINVNYSHMHNNEKNKVNEDEEINQQQECQKYKYSFAWVSRIMIAIVQDNK